MKKVPYVNWLTGFGVDYIGAILLPHSNMEITLEKLCPNWKQGPL